MEISIKKRGKKEKREKIKTERSKTLGNCSFTNSVKISIKKRGEKEKRERERERERERAELYLQ